MHYSALRFDYIDLTKFLILIFLIYLVLGKKYMTAFAITFAIPITIFGAERILMLLVLLFIFYVFFMQKHRSVYFRIFLAYGVFKTIIYTQNVLLFGDAFNRT